MSEEQSTNEPTTAETAAPEPAEKTPNSEAKKYRHRLREAEEQRDALQQKLEALQTESVQGAISRGLQHESVRDGRAVHLRYPGDLFLFTQTTAADYLTEAGTVDHQKLAEAAHGLQDQRPELIHQPNRVVIPNVGDSPASTAPKVTFAGAFAPQEPTG